jgi:FkbM family methyltransferase
MERIIKEHTFFDDLFRDEIVVIDLGACRGEFINEINEIYKIKKAILIEASPTNHATLIQKPNYVIYNNLISNTDDVEVSFYEDNNSPYNGSYMFNYFNGVEHKIKTKTLKSLMVENKIDYIDILKVDIEGAEYDVMPSISDEIYSKIGQITIEFHDFIDNSLKEKTQNIIDKLHNLGFKHKSKPIHYMNNSANYDVIFYK